MTDYCFSELECKIICSQIERRTKYRKEFLKLRTDPCAHSREAGYVFDPAIQRFVSMKTCQYEYFNVNLKTIRQGVIALMPFFVYGYAIWNYRSNFDKDCRCGRIKYRDRLFKLK